MKGGDVGALNTEGPGGGRNSMMGDIMVFGGWIGLQDLMGTRLWKLAFFCDVPKLGNRGWIEILWNQSPPITAKGEWIGELGDSD